LALTLALLSAAHAASGTNAILLFSFFRGNGEDGLFLAWSRDGLQWTELKPPGKSFLAPAVGGNLMRDPCLRQGPDGAFHLVWTTSWGRPAAFGYANSKDLIHWSEQRAIPAMESEPAVENVWAPELFYDGGFNVIDATLLAARGKFYLIVKDETRNPVKKHLRIAVGDRAEGPFGPAGAPVSGDWVEGPSAIQIGDEFYIYFDHYGKPQYYGAVKSTDLEHWQDVQVSFPKGARHGTVLKVPETIIHKIQNLPTHTTKQP